MEYVPLKILHDRFLLGLTSLGGLILIIQRKNSCVNVTFHNWSYLILKYETNLKENVDATAFKHLLQNVSQPTTK